MDEKDVREYGSRAAALFAAAAREELVEVTRITAWCDQLGRDAEMTFARDAGIYEVYRCPCGGEHCWAVR